MKTESELNTSSSQNIKFRFDQLSDCDLKIDAIYESGRMGNFSDGTLPRLLGVSNQGGFRYLGNKEHPKLIVLTSTFNDPEWPDHFDIESGILTYYGDNKKPGQFFGDTPRKGNSLLKSIFDSIHSSPPDRAAVPPILVFSNTGRYRDVRFLGLAVPGSAECIDMEDLVAIWKQADGQRFQNYRAVFTILDIAFISRAWLNDIKTGNSLSINSPLAWRTWIAKGIYMPLQAKANINYRKRSDQVPHGEQARLISAIHDYFQEDPVAFEQCATRIVKMMDDHFDSFDLTRPTRDGGRDAIGLYRVGCGPSAIFVEFALEAKCYRLTGAVGVKETSRLISRLKHRQFGVLVTTSYVHEQAYREIKEDEQPVLFIVAKDIAEILSRNGLRTVADVRLWLNSNFPIRKRCVCL